MSIKSIIIILLGLILFGCSKSYHPHEVQISGYRIDSDQTRQDKDVESVLTAYRDEMDTKMNEVLIESTGELRMGRPESTMGNFAADATEIMAEQYTGKPVHLAIHNYSGIRIGNIGRGPITLGRIYEMMPFDNYLVTVELSGEEVGMLCNFMAEKGGWPSNKNLTYEIEDKMAVNVRIDGERVHPRGTYVLATNNYVIQSAGYQDYLETKEITNTNIYVRDALAAYLRQLKAEGKKLEPKLDKRVTKK